MPALPKKQLSKSKQRSRASHYKSKASSVNKCSRCNSPVLSHRVCPSCGWYKDRYVINRGANGDSN
ncbi:MAG: 50S ribosomal protein L32 [Chloroflexi bacterium]|nr:50S ribosomal protein L32 [Chloroflexota bacterium]